MKIVVTIPDLHYPRHIFMGALEKYLADLNPTHLIYLGDAWDLEVVSHWAHQDLMKEKGLEYIRRTLKRESEGLRNLIRRHVDAAGQHLKEVIYFEGNHEAWLSQYQALYGNAGDPLTLEGFLKPKETGITKIVGRGKTLKLGHLTYLHGDNYSGGSLESIARKILNDYETNVIFGHFHGVNEVSKSSAIHSGEKKLAKCIGTMGNLNPGYMKNKPNQWQNAFHVAYIQDNGRFNDYTTRVIYNQFVAQNGVHYK